MSAGIYGPRDSGIATLSRLPWLPLPLRHPISLLARVVAAGAVVAAVGAEVVGVWSRSARWTVALLAVVLSAGAVEPARQEHGAVLLRWPASARHLPHATVPVGLALGFSLGLLARVPLVLVVAPTVSFEVEWLRVVLVLVVAADLVARALGERADMSSGRSALVVLMSLVLMVALERLLGGDHLVGSLVVLVGVATALSLWDGGCHRRG